MLGSYRTVRLQTDGANPASDNLIILPLIRMVHGAFAMLQAAFPVAETTPSMRAYTTAAR